MGPEFPYLAAGTVTVLGGWARDHRFPDNGGKAILATIILVIVASATAGSRIAPLVRALGLLLLLVAVLAATPVIPALNPKKKAK